MRSTPTRARGGHRRRGRVDHEEHAHGGEPYRQCVNAPRVNARHEPRPAALRALDREIVGCAACPRLVEWREQVAREKRASFRDDDYWGRPVTGFGDPHARVLVAGLAPAAHGANRTGRVFTGDRSGDFLFASLFRTGFANQPTVDVGRRRPRAPRRLRQRRGPVRAAGQQAHAGRARPVPAVSSSGSSPCWAGAGDRRARRLRLRRHRPGAGGGRCRRCRRRARSSPTGWRCPRRGAVVLGCYHPSQQNTFTGRLTSRCSTRSLPGPASWPAGYPRARDLVEGKSTARRRLRPAHHPVRGRRLGRPRRGRAPEPRVPRRRLRGHRRARHHRRVAGARRRRAARGRSTACARVCAEHGAQLIVGAGTNSTAKTIAAVEALAGTPALVAALIVVPYYVRPSEAGIVAHFEAVADGEPGAGRHLQHPRPHRSQPRARGDARAGAHTPTSSGVKQAVGALDADTLEILAGAPREFSVLGGDDPFLFPTVLMGGAGAICASAHVCTERFVAMIDCGLAGKVDDGRAHAEALLPGRAGLLRRAEPVGVQGRAPRAGSDPHARRPAAARRRVGGSVDAALAAVAAVRSRPIDIGTLPFRYSSAPTGDPACTGTLSDPTRRSAPTNAGGGSSPSSASACS